MCFPREEKVLCYKETDKTHHCVKLPYLLIVNQKQSSSPLLRLVHICSWLCCWYFFYININQNVKWVLMNFIIAVKNYLWEIGTIPIDKVGEMWKKMPKNRHVPNFTKPSLSKIPFNSTAHAKFQKLLSYEIRNNSDLLGQWITLKN